MNGRSYQMGPYPKHAAQFLPFLVSTDHSVLLDDVQAEVLLGHKHLSRGQRQRDSCPSFARQSLGKTHDAHAHNRPPHPTPQQPQTPG